MTDYYILSSPDKPLDIAACAHAVDRVTKLILYRGSCIYFPAPDASAGKVLLSIDTKDAAESETDWFLRNLAGELGTSVLTPDGVSVFEGSPDNDLSFIDTLPPPEEECLPVRLFFTVDGLPSEDLYERICTFFEQNRYEINGESDGYTVYLGANSYLDIFYSTGEPALSGEIDCSFSGAGVYAEVVELMEAFAHSLSAGISFVEDPRITYASDKDFEKLRQAFYLPLSQQLAFAVNDDREGLQAYLGWGTDAFEPEPIRGTLVTPFGRYSIEKLLSEIETYGLSYVCDRRFLTRNTPTDGADYYIREALNLMWNSTIGGKDKDFSIQEMFAIGDCENSLEAALEMGATAPFPKALYRRLCSYNDRPMRDISKNPEYDIHFEPGYARGDICYGFGHYLRRFKLAGTLCREEFIHGEEVFFHGDPKNGFKLMAEISYGYNGDGSESPLGGNWAKGDASLIETFDIGGTSVVRFLDGGLTDGLYRAEAEVYILDEVYRFAMASKAHEDVMTFRESLRCSISVEDWYDEYIRAESHDPHAPGATFCTNGVTPPCKAFTQPFPQYPEYFEPDAFNPTAFPEILGSLGGADSADPGAMLANLIGSIADRIRSDMEDGTEEEDEPEKTNEDDEE